MINGGLLTSQPRHAEPPLIAGGEAKRGHGGQMTSQSWNFGGARQSHHIIKYGDTRLLINSSIYRYFKRLENRILLTWLFEEWYGACKSHHKRLLSRTVKEIVLIEATTSTEIFDVHLIAKRFWCVHIDGL